MRKKLILFLTLLLFGSTSFLRADELTVYEGTETNAYVPVYGFYADAFLRCQYVMAADQLTDLANGEISEMRIAINSAALAAWTGTFQVYMTEVASTEISSFINTSDATTVYTGTLDGTGTELVVPFSTTYTYNGGNLLIGFDCIEKGNYSSINYKGITVSGAAVQGYSYSDLASVTATQRNFVPQTTFVYQSGTPVPPVPPTPVGEINIVPEEFALGHRPTNGWMEPFNVKIFGEQTTIEASISNTSEVEPFSLSEEINGITIPADGFGFEVIANNVAEGDYTEEFTVFYAANRDIKTAPVTGHIYTATAPDIVEMPRHISFMSNAYEDEIDSDIYPNYRLTADRAMANDAVYYFEAARDYTYNINTNTTDAIVAIYNKVPGEVLHITPDVEPVLMVNNGVMTDQPILAGEYYLVIASDNFTMLNVERAEIPAPEAITYVDPSPANYAEDVTAPLTLAWEGGNNATQYQVCFGTQYPPQPALDWTLVDENYGTFQIAELAANTQYFWQIKVKNSNGIQEGEVRGFTTSFIAPNSVTAAEVEIFTDEETLIKWKLAGQSAGFEGEITVCDGTETNSYIPVYGLWMDDNTRSEMIYPAEMLEEMQGGEISSLTYYISTPAGGSWAPASFNVYMMEVESTTLSSYYGSTDATVVYSGALDGNGTTMTIILDEPYTYEGGNLLVGIEEPVVGTYHSCYFYGTTVNGASASGYGSSLPGVSFNQRNFLPKTTFTCGGRGYRDVANNRSFKGFDVYYGETKANDELILERQYMLGNLPYNMDGHDINVKAVYDEGASNHSTPVVTVKVSGYSNFTGTVTELISGEPVEGVTVTFNGKDEFRNNVEFSGITDVNGKYTVNAKCGTYKGTATLEGCEPSVQTGLTLAYDATETVDFVIHESYNPVGGVIADELITDDGSMARVRWSLGTIAGGGSASTFFVDFDDSTMPEGWTTIDANNDGYDWVLGTQIGGIYLVSGASLQGTGHNASNDMICSGSYSNATNMAITPDNYLVSPQVNLVNGSTFSFWACGQDASYVAEHFGVFVSDNGTSDWTMVQEWTMTAKESGNVMSIGRNGQTRAQGSWHQYTVDLSAFAGQKYIAIRHFNCTDQFILDVDDIELTAGRGNRDVDYYTVVRKALVKETEITEADSVLLIDNYTDTIYGDFAWNNLEAGLYQYGVRAVYPTPATPGGKGDRSDEELTVYEGTTENYYVPMFILYFDQWTKTQYVIPAADLTDMVGAQINAIKYTTSSYNMPYTTVSAADIYLTEVDYTTINNYVDKAASQVVYSGTIEFVSTADGGEAIINFNTPYTYNGGNLLIGVENTQNNGWRRVDFKGQTIDGASISNSGSSTAAVSPIQRNFIPQTTFFYSGGGGGSTTNDDPITDFTWSNILPKDIEANVNINVHTAMGSVEGTEVSLTNLYENLAYNFEADETGLTNFENFHKGVYNLKADLGGYEASVAGEVIGADGIEVSIWSDTTITIELQEIYKPVDNLVISGTGFARWTDMLPHTDRVAQRYHVMCNGIFQGETAENYMQLDVTDLTVGETYEGAVAVVYSTGMSEFVTANFTLIDCSTVTPGVEELEAIPNCEDVILTWNGGTPTPPTPPTPPTGGWTEGFEGGLNGWTVLTVNTDGGEWLHSDNNPGGYDYTTYAHGGTGFAMCYSFIDYVGAYNTDSYLISPQMNSVSAGSTLTFWADNANDSYPESFSVCVSTAASPTASDFTAIWTGSAKGNSAGDMVRHNDVRLGNWRQHTIDLSAYAGQNIWIAFHDANYDMYECFIDDVTFTSDAKRGTSLAAASQVFGQANTSMVSTDNEQAINMRNDRDGNWYFYGDDVNATGIGASAAFYWAVMFPAGTYEGTTVTKVANYGSHDDTYGTNGAFNGTVTIYNDGTTSPSNAVGSMNISMPDTDELVEFVFPEPVSIDPSKNLWVVFYNATSTDYVASACADAGDANGRWVSLDGTTWQDLAAAGVPGYNWMIKAYIETGGGSAATNIVPGKYNIFMDGVLIGNTNDNYYTVTPEDYEEHEYEVRYVDANYNFSCPISVVAAAGTVASVTDLQISDFNDPEMTISWNGYADTYLVYYGVVDMSTGMVTMNLAGETSDLEFSFNLDQAAGYHLILVQAVTGDCGTDLQEEIDNGNYILIEYDDVIEKEVINNIYPNPTSGNLTIEAEGMTHVTVANVLGQVVYDADVEGDMMQLNMGQFNAGLYLVRVHSVNGVSVERITVVK